MSVLQMTTVHQEDWIKRFDPNKRFLRGRAYLLAKRIMDLLLVAVTIPLWLPLNGIVAIIILITSPGAPVVFKQLRTGKGGRRFYMYKFRTMVPEAEELKPKYAHLNELQWPDFKITANPKYRICLIMDGQDLSRAFLATRKPFRNKREVTRKEPAPMISK